MKTPEDRRAALVAFEQGRNDYLDYPFGPLRVSLGDDEWAFATEFNAMVVFRRGLVAGELVDAPEKMVAGVTRWLSAKVETSMAVQVSRLLDFSGQADVPCDRCRGERVVECDKCDGKGDYDCECNDCGDEHRASCGVCDGDGKRRCPVCRGEAGVRAATWLGAIINRELLAKTLAVIDLLDGDVVAERIKSTDGAGKYSGDCYRFRPAGSVDWVALIMSMAPHIKPTADFDKPETWTRATVAAK